MSISQKLLDRCRAIPTPANVTWDELVSLLRGVGFREISQTGGSNRSFVNDAGQKIFLHKPHPNNVVPRYAIRKVIDFLTRLNLISN